MEQLFFAGKAYLKINSLVKTPLHEFMAVERSGLWAPDTERYTSATVQQAAMRNSSGKLLFKIPLVDLGGKIPQQGYRWYKVFATPRGSRNIYGLLLV